MSYSAFLVSVVAIGIPRLALSAAEPARSPEGIPRHQEQRIFAAVPDKPRVPPRKPRTVLIWSTPSHLMDKDPHKGYCVPYGLCAMRLLGEKTGAYKPVISDDLSLFLPENIRQFDAIIMNNSCGPWITPTEADMPRLKSAGDTPQAVEQVLRRSFLDWLGGGGGVFAIHFAIAANAHWPEFREVFGARFTGHPWNEEVGILVEEPDYPLAAAFGGQKHFRIADEIYQFGPPYDRSKLRVFLSIDTERTNMGVKWIDRPDNDFAQAWTKSWGKGRVAYTGFGHRTEIFWNPVVLQFYLDAIQFAAGDLDAPTTPRDSKPSRRAPGPTPSDVREAKMRARKVNPPTEQQIKQIEAACPDSAPAKPAKPRKVLVWGHVWTHTPNPYAEAAIAALGRKTGAFSAVISDDPRLLLGDRIVQFDAVVMNNIHEPEPFLPEDFKSLDAQQQTAARQFDTAVKQSIMEYVRSGRGIVGIHAATAAFQNWAEYGEMMGGFYGGHIFQDVAIKLDEPEHPINACFGGKPLNINDEIYIFRGPHSRKTLRVLLSLDPARMPDPGKRPDRDYAVSWVRMWDRGRVFYTTLGHAESTYWNPAFLRHVLAGIQFATGDLAAPADPLPQP